METTNTIKDTPHEVIFWKVFHNIYLFQLIIGQIKTLEWPHIYDRHTQNQKPKKFKDIKGLEEMINKGQYGILKCKLEAGENIIIDEWGIKTLFQFGYPKKGFLGYEAKCRKLSKIEYKKAMELESFKQLLKYRFQDMIKYDLYQFLLIELNERMTNLEAITILNDPIYNYPIQPRHLQLAITNCPQFVNTIRSLLNKDEIKNNNNNNTLVNDYHINFKQLPLNKQTMEIVDFNQPKPDLIKKFVNYLISFNPTIKLFLNNQQNPMKYETESFLNVWKEITTNEKDRSYSHKYKIVERGSVCGVTIFSHDCIFYKDLPGGMYFNTSNQLPVPIISCIELIIDQFNSDCESDQVTAEYYNCVQTVVNLLFKRLIRSKFTTIENVKLVHHKINTSVRIKNGDLSGQSLSIDHSTFQSFYYILLKSPRLLMFVMNLQSLVDPDVGNCSNRGDWGYYGGITEKNGQYINREPLLDNGEDDFKLLDFIRLIDPRIFTFKFIHGEDTIYGSNGSSFNSILEKLIEILVHSSAIKFTKLIDYNKSLDLMLIYLLEIHHIEQFFKQLVYIKELLENSNIIIGNFPTMINEKRVFKFSKRLLETSIKQLDQESFESFIQFYSYENLIESSKWLDHTPIHLKIIENILVKTSSQQ